MMVKKTCRKRLTALRRTAKRKSLGGDRAC